MNLELIRQAIDAFNRRDFDAFVAAIGDAKVVNRFFHVWTFRDGKVVRLSPHTDKSRALEAAGLEE